MSAAAEARQRLGAEVTFGSGTATRLPDLATELHAHRVLLVCGRRSFEASGAAAMLPRLRDTAVVERWSDFSPNTDAADLARGLEIVQSFAPDLVLGVGGGSAMDMAKLLVAFSRVPPDRVHDEIQVGRRIDERDIGLVLAPTTSGSGSEATHFAVVYIGHDKHSVAGPAMRPDRVVLDPDLSRSSTSYQRATSGIDAICQAIESLWATQATEESRAHARAGLSLALQHLPGFVADANEPDAVGMCLGSHLAGRAIDISKTTAAHALSYGLTKRHGISHGHAVALTLGPFLELHAGVDPAGIQPSVSAADHAAVMREIVDALGAEDGTGAHRAFTTLLRRIGLEPSLRALGVEGEDELTLLADAVNVERLGNNPVVCDHAALVAILRAAR